MYISIQHHVYIIHIWNSMCVFCATRISMSYIWQWHTLRESAYILFVLYAAMPQYMFVYIYFPRLTRISSHMYTLCHPAAPTSRRVCTYVYTYIERYSSIYRKINATAIYHRLTMQQQYTQCLCTHRQSIQLYGACNNVDRYCSDFFF